MMWGRVHFPIETIRRHRVKQPLSSELAVGLYRDPRRKHNAATWQPPRTLISPNLCRQLGKSGSKDEFSNPFEFGGQATHCVPAGNIFPQILCLFEYFIIYVTRLSFYHTSTHSSLCTVL